MNKAVLKSLLEELSNEGAQLVAVSKTRSNEEILQCYNEGVRDFGENRVQELTAKQDSLPKDIKWHMIGRLQRNKVKYIAPFIHLIHSVSSIPLLQTIQKEAVKNNRVIPVLLQLKIADEGTKQGLDALEIETIIQDIHKNHYPNIDCKGLMGMASFTTNEDQLRSEFKSLTGLAQKIMNHYEDFWNEDEIILSFGMSGDFRIALNEGSNMVRIGSLIFGNRS